MNDTVSVNLDAYVATVEIHRPPNNFFDLELIEAIADAYETLDNDDACRAIVLCSEGKHFCAGADFGGKADDDDPTRELRTRSLYDAAVRLFRARTPVVAAIQGGAIGGGLGLALSADFRIACSQARFSANFSRLGFHPGFGLSVTLPRLIGHSQADLMTFTGRRIKGDEAVAMGLADELVELAEVRDRAHTLAAEIAASAPLAVRTIRDTARRGLADAVEAMTAHELEIQTSLRKTTDFKEGIKAMAERRAPDFKGS
tara:strand:+ start:858 stop:1631 length:774 start_codon:yes stop_codon:yes gene_type:complete